MGSFRILSPRTCPNCTIENTLWWALAIEGKSLEDLSKRQIEVLTRINNEPLSILPNSDDGLSPSKIETIAQEGQNRAERSSFC